MTDMTYTDDQIREALANEYEFLCHDDFDPDEDMTEEQYDQFLAKMNRQELMNEAQLDEYYTLNDFMRSWYQG